MKGRKKERVQVTIRKYERLYFRHKKRVFNKKKKKRTTRIAQSIS